MSARVVIGVISLAGVAICGIVASHFHSEMLEKVNNQLSQEQRISPTGWYAPKTERLHMEYRRNHPGGHLIAQKRAVQILGLGCLLGCAWALGFLGTLR